MENKLGLGISPESVTYLFIGEAESEEGTTAWYKLDFETTRPIPVKEDALTGVLTNVVINKKIFKNKDNYKINIHINADHRFILRTGVGTTFSRGFVLSIIELINRYGEEALKNPITITVKQGEDSSKAVFCGVFYNGEKIIPRWDGEIVLAPLIANLQKALGQLVQTREMMEDSELYYQAQVKFREEKKNEIVAVPKKSKKRGTTNG